ncbi:MAG: large subunit ribosomal protein [Clostridiales bacterium]|jgi:large subunit ribosomal protein L6|nr:50S ribosomal protein L6 [Eubacteriales bacterium]MDD3197650.1 50S ribosomal protein L6 [Eubacteriales bacterium]MDD3502995.1 50S ribosomal protein L6 [Eubacteriales bacterium]MDD4682856.1 50S ribosomal protein L6 [Eubacteriales bacterium]MDN5313775.1 large subunit ribosomal protein [Clostridiales bacterium]
MSRIGRMPIAIPAGIEVKVENQTVTVKSGKNVLTQNIHSDMIVKVEDQTITVNRPSDEKKHRELHGLTRSLINNMIIGLSQGFSKNLEINGVGFKATKQGKKLVLNVGFSHPIEMEEPEGITIDVPAANRIVVKGADKQLVGETAAKIRAFRTPDPYKGKGIKYDFEVLRLKEGKTGAKGKGK